MSNLQRVIDGLPDGTTFDCYDEGLPTGKTTTALKLKTSLDLDSMELGYVYGHGGRKQVAVYRSATRRFLYVEQ